MSLQPENWSFTEWQCGMGIVPACKDQKLDWDNPRSWQTLVDAVIPLTEVGITFGFQYISSQIGPGTTAAINSLRCMFNNFGTNTWQFGAGTWLMLKYAGVTADLVPYMDEAYTYVCTCIWDMNGLKSMLGADAASNEAFAFCSEGSAREAAKGQVRAQETAAAREEAARQSIIDAARNKMVGDTVTKFNGLEGCSLRDTQSFYKEQCFTGVSTMKNEVDNIVTFWSAQLASSGGPEDTKNRNEQTNHKEALWVQLGAVQAVFEMYPDRYNEDGSLKTTCSDPTSGATVYGDACTDIITTWAAANTPNCQGTDACNAAISCGTDGALTSAVLCDLTDLQYGYSRWVQKSSITCSDPATLQALIGYDNCVQLPGSTDWVARAAYINPDQPRFRTIGEKPITQIPAENIKCLAANAKDVLSGADNCWPHWIQGAVVEVGTDIATKVAIRQDTFIWLTQEGISCEGGLTGYANCKIGSESPCNASKLERLNITADSTSICVPNISWVPR